jgi:lathosterol oxidase
MLQVAQFIFPAHPIFWTATFAFLLYGIRFALFAGLAFLVAHPMRKGGFGRPHADVPIVFDTAANVRRELTHSLLTILIFGLVIAVLYGYGLINASLLYYKISAYPLWWFWLSVLLMLILHDTFFYWLHRVMHSRFLFARMHRIHHESVYPTAFAAYSFHPLEALAEALLVTIVIYVLPVHPVAFLMFQTISTAYNVYGHCGREFYPQSTASHWLGKWLNTSTLHSRHHLKGRGNYGLYFTFWDRAMGTIEIVSR